MTILDNARATSSATTPTRRFPTGFIWGCGTAAYQIEGAVAEDGRTPSMWDTFSHTPGATAGGDTGDIACDHYHRMPEDVATMARLGLGAYRFSISWPRVLPAGHGPVERRGLDFYSRLIDELLAYGIEPFVTVYHWDLPQVLQDAGGWASRETALHFGELAATVGAALGDRVSAFATLNEPWCSAYLGHSTGAHAPGLRDNATALRVVHHLNLAHGLGTAALRATVPARTDVSLTLNLAQIEAASDSPADQAAARHADGLANRLFLDPVLRGHYPADVIEQTRHITDWSFVRDGDLETIAAPIDMLGVNYYSPARIAAATPELAIKSEAADDDAPSQYPGSDLAYSVPQDGPYTAMGWRIDSAAFTDLLQRVCRDYPGVPLMITENGAAFDDVVEPDQTVHDADRIEYLSTHIAAVHDAIESGADVRGYFLWSLLDNFEWAQGYDKRFGIVHVDYADAQRRRLKDSAHWYREVIAANGLPE